MSDNSRIDPNSPAFAAWLGSLNPDAELAMRYAMRALFPQLNADQEFSKRLHHLDEQVDRSSKKFAGIANRAMALEAMASAPWSPDEEGMTAIEDITTAAASGAPKRPKRKTRSKTVD